MIVQANSFRIPMADNSVHAVVTSPPYFGLRDYGLEPIVFGGRSDCQHEWGEATITNVGRNDETPEELQRRYEQGHRRSPASKAIGQPTEASTGQFCRHCQAWLGSYGLEPSIGLFVQHSVEVAREIRRVLRPDGVFWLNLGDSFATGKNGRSAADGKALGNDDRTFRDKPFSITELPAKNLCGIPWRVALALQADGWILRSAPNWVKRNPMPESVGDRPGNGHENVFMFVKSARYWWDATAVRREPTDRPKANSNGYKSTRRRSDDLESYGRNGYGESCTHPDGRALRTSDFFFDSLDHYIAHLTHIRDNGGLLLETDGSPAAFVVNPRGYAGAHYATFPLALVTPMILSSAPDKCCPKCGKGWTRITEPTPEYAAHLGKDWADYEQDAIEGRGHAVSGQRPTKRGAPSLTASYKTTGFRPACDCGIAESTPGVVLDPFAGSGTVGQACRELGRRFVGLDLSPKYLSENALPRSERLTSAASLATLPMFAEAL